MSYKEDENQTLQELLAGKILGDLSVSEEAELNKFASEAFEEDVMSLERTASAIDMSYGSSSLQSMPEKLKERIARDAPDFLNSNDVRSVSLPVKVAPDIHVADTIRSSPIAAREWVAWLALAGSLMFIVSQWVGIGELYKDKEQRSKLTRVELIKQASDKIQWSWAKGKTPFESEVAGDVVWGSSRQQGYMRFVNMPKNDPTKEQYQLWIVDPDRDSNPVDGGVFDISSTGEVVIAIDARLPIARPAAFAITIEKTGGVVVSTQDRLPLIASTN